MFIEAILLAMVQTVGTFLTFGLKSGSKKRTSMKSTIRTIRKIQWIDIVSTIAFGVWGSLSGTAIGAATAVASGLINTIILQSIKTLMEQKYEAIWTIEYHLVLSENERRKIGKGGLPTLSLAQAIFLYKTHGLKETIVHEAVMNYTGEIDSSITPDDRAFAGKQVKEWKELSHTSIEKTKFYIPVAAKTVGVGIGKVCIQGTGALLGGIKKAGVDLYRARKERKKCMKS